MVIVAILEVRRAELATFREFEHAAARIMREHQGDLERAIVVDNGAGDLVTEIHVVRFASQPAFDAYRASEALAALKPLRDASVVGTTLHVGEDGPAY